MIGINLSHKTGTVSTFINRRLGIIIITIFEVIQVESVPLNTESLNGFLISNPFLEVVIISEVGIFGGELCI